MTRTNIDIDDELIARAMRRYSLPTKRAAVELALSRLVGPALDGAALAAFIDEAEGSGWDLDPDNFDDNVATL